MRTLTRVAILLALFCLPFVLLAFGGRRREGSGLFLIFPLFLALPVALSALLVFAPLERALDARGLGHVKNVVVPVLGGGLVVLLAIAWWTIVGALNAAATRTPPRMWKRIAGNRTGLVLWAVVGVVSGALWRLTDWAVTLVRLRAPG